MMTLEYTLEGDERMSHAGIKGKNSPVEESAGAKALTSMSGMLSE